MASRNQDKYANIALAKNIETAANTLTSTEVLTGVSLGTGTGILIDQLEYYIEDTYTKQIIAQDDGIKIAWTTTNNIIDIKENDRQVIHMCKIELANAEAGIRSVFPIVFQFFPAIIVAAPRVYLSSKGYNLANPVTVYSRMYYRFVKLTPQEYLEIAETFQLTS